MLNVFFSQKVLKTGEVFPMLNLGGVKGPISPHRFNIFNISPVLSTFRKKTFNSSLIFVKVDSRNVKCFFLDKVLKTGELLNTLNLLGLEDPFSPTDLSDFVCLLSLLSLSISLSLSLSLFLSLPPSLFLI